MKIILSSPIPGEIAQLKVMLESADIACFTRNEISAGLSPEIPLSESTPELWIQDDHRLSEALEIKRAWKAAGSVGGSDWKCPTCGEASEPQFSSCWKCGTTRPGDHLTHVGNDVNSEPDRPIAQPEKPEAVEELENGIPCVVCGKLIGMNIKYCPYCDYTQPYQPAA
jgi:hypothetical protein